MSEVLLLTPHLAPKVTETRIPENPSDEEGGIAEHQSRTVSENPTLATLDQTADTRMNLLFLEKRRNNRSRVISQPCLPLEFLSSSQHGLLPLGHRISAIWDQSASSEKQSPTLVESPRHQTPKVHACPQFAVITHQRLTERLLAAGRRD